MAPLMLARCSAPVMCASSQFARTILAAGSKKSATSSGISWGDCQRRLMWPTALREQGVRVELEAGADAACLDSAELDALLAPLLAAPQRKLPIALLCSDEAACGQRCAKAFLAVKVRTRSWRRLWFASCAPPLAVRLQQLQLQVMLPGASATSAVPACVSWSGVLRLHALALRACWPIASQPCISNNPCKGARVRIAILLPPSA